MVGSKKNLGKMGRIIGFGQIKRDMTRKVLLVRYWFKN